VDRFSQIFPPNPSGVTISECRFLARVVSQSARFRSMSDAGHTSVALRFLAAPGAAAATW
jgi:hypothetical protein